MTIIGKVAVLGGGAMGTACSILLAGKDRPVSLWMRDPVKALQIAETRENDWLLPGVAIPGGVEITADIHTAVAGAELLVAAVPSAYLRSALTLLSPHLPKGCPVVSVIKGIEVGTLKRPSQIVTETLGPRPVAALCGPSHAEEIGRRLPASVVAASESLELAESVQAAFSTDRFRVYTNTDILGVELAGALKNVVAIAAGISDGLGYGDNAKAALLTRGIVEMTRFGVTLGADPETFAGLAGIGDLITTCFSRFGRNRRVGEGLGQGRTLTEILAGLHGVAEGVNTCRSVLELARSRDISMPITGEVYRVLFEGVPPEQSTSALMQRPTRAETRH